MDFELRRAKEKLDREQKERKERAKIKLQREKKVKEEAIKLREAIEASQRSRRFDAIEAQRKADQQMEESLFAGGGITFSHILEAVSFEGQGDKIKLPPSSFTQLSDQGAFDKGPLHFCLSVVHQENPSDMNTAEVENLRNTHSGVLELSSLQMRVLLSFLLMYGILCSLYTTQDCRWLKFVMFVHYIRLPKGTYAKLQPDGIGFSDLPNHKAVLETSLRQRATLSQDDIFTVNYGELAYKLHVLELKPSSSVSVLETDIEVDVVGP